MKALMAFLVCLLPVFATANTIFYQPHNTDGVLGGNEWQEIFAEARDAGFTSIVVQWSRYGDADFGGAGGWLEQVVGIAHDQGLSVVMGLYSDPDFFTRITGTDFEVGAYLNSYLVKNLRILEQLAARPVQKKISGWYLPAEFDDRYWFSVKRQNLLRDQLGKWDAALAERTSKPWSTTSFFTGWQSPANYADWLRGLKYDIWIQDGSGTGVLTDGQRTFYLDAIDKVNSGVIVEAFQQRNDEEKFVAQPRDQEEVRLLEKNYRGLGFQRVGYFSLRYMPFARGRLCGSCKS
ncbi:DUF4434 domain-containing protein [uncultured Microbulbifer sp.]|uniref:DUF4434 domain-containing protein n=1 Tax=uncultured Microbulbifer sp. TaxID=348147 RepID=UPI0025DE844E|nr:DUF4434 domain-containing protein [uncultured Microbulbifer sp.]